uniref:Integrase catalytic domain-containing protein n=1 Tax=Anser cygnoides TaxID=8845 RepID=A0A8B9EFT2_ANSCY
MKALGINWEYHTPWHPQSSGKVERMNGEIKKQLTKLTLETKTSWIKCLPLALLNIRTKPRTDLGISPFEMLYAQYYCAYWGCETIASAWNPGAGKDKYLTAGWILGRTWGVRYYEHGADRGGFILIKKNRPPETPQLIGSNRGLGDKEQLHKVPRSTQSSRSTSTTETAPFLTQLPSVTEGNMVAPISGMWKVINASFQVLNQTNPDITRGCWLCVNVGTPEYSNETNPHKCSWGQEVGITLTQVTGRGRCIGTVPKGKIDLCNIIENGHQSHDWLIPAN